MKFLSKLSTDTIFLGVSSLIIASSSLLLYANFTKKIDVGNAKKIGSITFKKEEAQRKYAGQVIWETIDQNSPVYNNDSIKTSDLSEAIVRLGDGTEINLDENSLILVAMTGKGLNIDFTTGSITANRSNVDSEDATEVNIQTKETTVSIGNSDIKLSKTENKELDLTVTKGTAKIKTDEGEKKIEKDEKVLISKNKEAKVIKIALKPTSPAINSYHVTDKNLMPIQFSWEPVKGSDQVQLEIAYDKNFRRIAKKSQVQKNSTLENLNVGTYYWRLKAFNKSTNKEEFSDTRKINILRDRPIRLTYPQNDSAIAFTERLPIINFRWLKNELATSYKIEISSDFEFKNIIKSIQTTLNSISIDNLTRGTYFWRIKTNINISSVSHNGVSPVYSFKIFKKEISNPPVLIAPSQGTSVSSYMLEKTGFMFSWNTDTPYSNYRLKISEDNKFNKIVFESTTQNNYYSIAKKFESGTYYWRVESETKSGKQVFSQPNRLNVLGVKKITLTNPTDKTLVTLAEKEETSNATFKWNFVDQKGKYVFELSKDLNFFEIVDKERTKKNNHYVKKLSQGDYYWRVKLLDNDNSPITTSDVYKLSVYKEVKELPSVVQEVIENKKKESDRLAKELEEKRKTEELAKKEAEEKRKAEELAQKEAEEKRKERELARKEAEEQRKAEEEKRRKSSYTIESSVKDGNIYINNKYIGKKKVVYKTTTGKVFYVKIQAEDYNTYYKTIRAKSGKNKLMAELTKYTRRSRIIWKTNLASDIMGKPVYYNNKIILPTKNRQLIGLTANGGRMWRTQLDSMARCTPAVYKNRAYIVSLKGTLYSIDISNGRIIWKKKVIGPLLFGAKPLIAVNKIFIATSYGMFQCFTLTGKKLWTRNLEEGVNSSIVYYQGLIYVGTDNSRIYALRPKNGKVYWKTEIDSRIFAASPRIYKDMLFVGSYNGTFYALKARSGSIRWKFETGGSILTTPAFHKDTVYFGSENGMFYALNIRKGKQIWKFDTGNEIISSPDVTTKNVIVSSGDYIFSLNLISGKMSWKERFANDINTSLTVVKYRIFVGLENGAMISLRI